MLPFGFCLVLDIVAAFLTFPEDDCLPGVEAGGRLDFVFVAAMLKGFDGGGTDGGMARVNGVLEEVAPGDGGRPTSGCFRESRGLRNIEMAFGAQQPVSSWSARWQHSSLSRRT